MVIENLIANSTLMQRCRYYLDKHVIIEQVVLVDDPVRLGAVVLVKLQGPPNPMVGRRAGGRGRAFSSSIGAHRGELIFFLFPVPRMCPQA